MPGCRLVPPTAAALAGERRRGEELPRRLDGEGQRPTHTPPPPACAEVDRDAFNVSAAAADGGVFSASSGLLVTAESSCRVACLASVAALARPLSASVQLTVGETSRRTNGPAGGGASLISLKRLFSVTEALQEGDCGAALPVVASLCAALLLLLICTGAVLCYRWRRQASRPPPHPHTHTHTLPVSVVKA